MQELVNCKCCGKLYKSNGMADLCGLCFEKDEKVFERVRTYLLEHPFANIYEVSTELDISLSRLKRYLREERLMVVEENNSFLTCECCKSPIHSGKYCDACDDSIKRGNIKVIYNDKDLPSSKEPDPKGETKLKFLTYKEYKARGATLSKYL